MDLASAGLDGDVPAPEASRLACLMAQLPAGSRVRRSADPDSAWDEATRMLWHIEYDLRCVLWTVGGGKGRRPRPLPTPGERRRNDRAIEASLASKGAVDAALAEVIGAAAQTEGGQDGR